MTVAIHMILTGLSWTAFTRILFLVCFWVKWYKRVIHLESRRWRLSTVTSLSGHHARRQPEKMTQLSSFSSTSCITGEATNSLPWTPSPALLHIPPWTLNLLSAPWSWQSLTIPSCTCSQQGLQLLHNCVHLSVCYYFHNKSLILWYS